MQQGSAESYSSFLARMAHSATTAPEENSSAPRQEQQQQQQQQQQRPRPLPPRSPPVPVVQNTAPPQSYSSSSSYSPSSEEYMPSPSSQAAAAAAAAAGGGGGGSSSDVSFRTLIQGANAVQVAASEPDFKNYHPSLHSQQRQQYDPSITPRTFVSNQESFSPSVAANNNSNSTLSISQQLQPLLFGSSSSGRVQQKSNHASGSKMWNALEALKKTPALKFPENYYGNNSDSYDFASSSNSKDMSINEIVLSPNSPFARENNRHQGFNTSTIQSSSSSSSSPSTNTKNTRSGAAVSSQSMVNFFNSNKNREEELREELEEQKRQVHRQSLASNVARSVDAQRKRVNEMEAVFDQVEKLNILEQRLTDHQREHTTTRAQRLLDLDRARWEVQRCDFRVLEVQAQLESACTSLQERLLSRIATVKQLQEDTIRQHENRLHAEIRGEHDRHIAAFRDDMAERSATAESLKVALQQLAAHVEVQCAQIEHDLTRRSVSPAIDKLVQIRAQITAENQKGVGGRNSSSSPYSSSRAGSSSSSSVNSNSMDSMATMLQNFAQDMQKQLDDLKHERITFHERIAKRCEELRSAKFHQSSATANRKAATAAAAGGGDRRAPSL